MVLCETFRFHRELSADLQFAPLLDVVERELYRKFSGNCSIVQFEIGTFWKLNREQIKLTRIENRCALPVGKKDQPE